MSALMRLDGFLWLRIDHFFERPTCLWILGPVPFVPMNDQDSVFLLLLR